MKKVNVIYNEYGQAESITDNSMYFEQENDSLQIDAYISTDKKVRAYIRASNKNSTVTDELTAEDGMYSLIISDDYMSRGALYVGFELYDDTGYIERLEPLKMYIDGFVSVGMDNGDNVYTVTVRVGEVTTLESEESAIVENSGTKKDVVLNFGIPRGEPGIQGEKGDPGPQGERGPQGIQGEKGETGDDGYTPQKGIDYFTEKEITEFSENIKSNVCADFDKRIQHMDIAESLDDETFLNDYKMPGLYHITFVDDADEAYRGILVVESPTEEYVLQSLYYNAATFKRLYAVEEGIWSDWSERYAIKSNVDAKIGDIETALDSIITMQNSLIGGDAE